MTATTPIAYFRIRVYQNGTVAIGPGRVTLLEAIAQTGSISAAARHLKMSYRRAWTLVNSTNKALRSPAVVSSEGGISGGGSHLTPVGHQIIEHYRSAEKIAAQAAQTELNALCDLLATPNEITEADSL